MTQTPSQLQLLVSLLSTATALLPSVLCLLCSFCAVLAPHKVCLLPEASTLPHVLTLLFVANDSCVNDAVGQHDPLNTISCACAGQGSQ